MKYDRKLIALAFLAALPAAAGMLSGVVVDSQGAPIQGVNLDFRLESTGETVSPPNDGTDPSGYYTTLLDPGVYEVSYVPPRGSRLAPHVESNVDLTVDRVIDVALPAAWFVQGDIVRSDTGLPAAQIDLDFDDLVAGNKLLTPFDNSDAAGHYIVAVPVGIYEVTFDLPDPRELAPASLLEVSIDGSGDLLLPVVTLVPGHLVEGEALDPDGDSVVGADLDFLLAGSTEKIFTKGDNTDARGRFETVVPQGTFDVVINPPRGSSLRPLLVPGLVVPGNAPGSQTLEVGLALQGVVRDPAGAPVPGADLNLSDASTGQDVPTAWDDTDTDGRYLVRVPSGLFDVTWRPLRNSLLDPTTLPGVAVLGDSLMPDVVLPYHDADSDSVADVQDGCPFEPDPVQGDVDADGVGDACDRCPRIPDARQEDNDRDGAGDACDADDDGDGITDDADVDRDGDGAADAADNCPGTRDAYQHDGDGDGDGDACDPDDGAIESLEAATRTGFFFRPETGATSYRVYRQRIAWLSAINFGTCLHESGAAALFHDDDLPEPGEGLSYLVTAVVGGVEGSLGMSPFGPRPNLRPCR